MKNYEVKAIKNFKDALENKERQTNDIFLCTKERYEYLKEHNAVELVKVIEEEKKVEKVEKPTEKVYEEFKPINKKKKTSKK